MNGNEIEKRETNKDIKKIVTVFVAIYFYIGIKDIFLLLDVSNESILNNLLI